MLQGVRDNMKGTMVVVIVVLFIIPMVLSGIGGSFLGSVGGTDAASVNGETITRAELRREVFMQKQRMLNQGGDPTSDSLKDENLLQPVLEQLTRRTALIVSAKDSGMAAPEKLVGEEIVKTKEFFTDGKFDEQKFKRLISNVGYTPATYKDAIARDVVLNQSGSGLRHTSFITDAEVEQLVALLYQKRSFFTVEIPRGDLEKDIVVEEQEINAYYEENQDAFKEPESVSVEYLELSVDSLMLGVEVADEAVKELFEKELVSAEYAPQYEIAHILIEGEGDDAQKKISDVKGKLAEGALFEGLAKEYSDDVGSKESGGMLGALLDGYPKEFSTAVATMEEGEVSEPVSTDSGTHFIKVVKKTVPEPPTFESRKVALENQLKRNQAEEIYVENLEALGDLTYSANELTSAAKTLNITVLESQSFNRLTGLGIASDAKVRNAAFESDVLNEGHNSPVIEVSNDKAVVLRKLSHKPEHVKELAKVEGEIKKTLIAEKSKAILAEKAQSFIEGVDSAEAAELKAGEMKYEFVQHDDAKRTDPVASFAAREKAFSMPAPANNGIEISSDLNEKGDYLVIGLMSVKKGEASDIEKAQLQALKFQSASQLFSSEMASYQTQIIDSAEVKVF